MSHLGRSARISVPSNTTYNGFGGSDCVVWAPCFVAGKRLSHIVHEYESFYLCLLESFLKLKIDLCAIIKLLIAIE